MNLFRVLRPREDAPPPPGDCPLARDLPRPDLPRQHLAPRPQAAPTATDTTTPRYLNATTSPPADASQRLETAERGNGYIISLDRRRGKLIAKQLGHPARNNLGEPNSPSRACHAGKLVLRDRDATTHQSARTRPNDPPPPPAYRDRTTRTPPARSTPQAKAPSTTARSTPSAPPDTTSPSAPPVLELARARGQINDAALDGNRGTTSSAGRNQIAGLVDRQLHPGDDRPEVQTLDPLEPPRNLRQGSPRTPRTRFRHPHRVTRERQRLREIAMRAADPRVDDAELPAAYRVRRRPNSTSSCSSRYSSSSPMFNRARSSWNAAVFDVEVIDSDCTDTPNVRNRSTTCAAAY